MYYQNVRLDPDAFHFVYVGEAKACCLNHFVWQGLSRILGRSVGWVSIVPDILGDYRWGNVAVLNPQAERLRWATGRGVSMRVPMAEFAARVGREPAVRRLVERLLARQGQLPVWMFESRPELSLCRMPGVSLVGPQPSIVSAVNDKTWQYAAFAGLMPLAEHRICTGCGEMLRLAEEMRPSCPDGVFVSMAYSAGGGASMVTRSSAECAARFVDPSARYLVSRYIPHVFDPTVLGVVANDSDVYIAGVADMTIEHGNAFRGSCHPSLLPPDIQENLRALTTIVGRRLGSLGFRGIFGCDYIVDAAGRIHFIEVNPRKQGTTMEFCCTLERTLPPGAANLFELEYHAVTRGEFPDNTVEPDHFAAPRFFWGTWNHKTERDEITKVGVPQHMTERELFALVDGGGVAGHVVREHVGGGMLVRAGTFLGRVVAVGQTREAMLAELAVGRMRLRESIARPAA
ncbi:hypothetical protein GGQ74_000914 [Desulfobaculum xiamenense]|uniref:ATP-grasp domain-containing protein n=1 Tax=Desulfobaculum xiamenense TaxID=995050 RepID=A0A846QPX9_9BACT|nr:ATP-grasp domain-containing protein [Desulfobaculum xiamenense]NJB67274.1 hypothetical protein [Desulfobaculum xiamenense]